jgi:hypothetical protein
MSRRQTKQQIEEIIIEWANWQCRMLDTSCIGYPSMTPDARMRNGVMDMGSGAGSRAPNVNMYGIIKTVDRAIRVMPSNLRQAIEMKYCNEWDESVKPSGSFNRRLDSAFTWIEASIAMSRAA